MINHIRNRQEEGGGTVDNFKTIYLILKVLESSLDTGLNEEEISAERLGITERRRLSLLAMLQDNGYIKGFAYRDGPLGTKFVNLDGLEITLKGLEYLEENTTMKKVCRILQDIKTAIPGA